MNRRVLDLLAESNIPFTAVLDVARQRVSTFGDSRDLEADDIFKQYFANLVALKQWLDAARFMPKTVCQGNVCAVFGRPAPDVIACLFYHEERDLPESFRWTVALDAKLRELWSEPGELPQE